MPRSITQYGLTMRALPVLGLGAALVLTGCSSSDDEAETSPTPTVEAPAESPEPEVTETEAPADDAAGSDSSDPLQAYVDLELAQLDRVGSTLDAMYSDITVEPEPPSGIVYTYTFADQLDPAVAEQSVESIASTLDELTTTAVFPMMESKGVEGPQSATYIYLNADGTEIFNETFTSE